LSELNDDDEFAGGMELVGLKRCFVQYNSAVQCCFDFQTCVVSDMQLFQFIIRLGQVPTKTSFREFMSPFKICWWWLDAAPFRLRRCCLVAAERCRKAFAK